MEQASQLMRIVEGALFAADRPLSLDDILNLFADEERPEREALKEAVEAVQASYEGRGICLKKLGSGYQFQTDPELSSWVSRLWEERAPRYSRALLETLALVAYRQPITRGEIEDVRGVAVSSNIVRTLLEREWVRVVGHKEVPGRPALYATTKEFLDYFGLARLQDLPPLTELVDLDEAGKRLEASLQEEVEGENEASQAENPAENFEAISEEVMEDALELPADESGLEHEELATSS